MKTSMPKKWPFFFLLNWGPAWLSDRVWLLIQGFCVRATLDPLRVFFIITIFVGVSLDKALQSPRLLLVKYLGKTLIM